MTIKDIVKAIKKLKKRAKTYHEKSRIELYGESATIYLHDPCGATIMYDIPDFTYANIQAAKAWIKANLKIKQQTISAPGEQP